MLLVWATPALSHDLRTACCHDLEDVVSELESTVAAKGNSKVRLSVSGWINEALFAWDDGIQRGLYEGTNLIEQPRFRFTGDVQIAHELFAGYLLEVGIEGTPSNQWNQNTDVSQNADPTKQDGATAVKKSSWFLRSSGFGQLAVGLNAMATYHLLDDADASQTRYASDADAIGVYMSAFFIRSGGNLVGTPALKWTDVLRGWKNSTPGQGDLRDVIRYDSPKLNGFVASASWGEKSLGDVALGYDDVLGDFHLVARAGYGSSGNPGTTVGGASPGVVATYVAGGSPCISTTSNFTSLPGFHCAWGGAAATLLHSPTGLYVYGGRGEQFTVSDHAFVPGTVFEHTSDFWIIQPGIERDWLPLGKTTLFGEYRQDDPGSNPGKTVDAKSQLLAGRRGAEDRRCRRVCLFALSAGWRRDHR